MWEIRAYLCTTAQGVKHGRGQEGFQPLAKSFYLSRNTMPQRDFGADGRNSCVAAGLGGGGGKGFSKEKSFFCLRCTTQGNEESF